MLRNGHGRDGCCQPPPAQIPACAAHAPGSSLGFWRRTTRNTERARASTACPQITAAQPTTRGAVNGIGAFSGVDCAPPTIPRCELGALATKEDTVRFIPTILALTIVLTLAACSGADGPQGL